MNRNSHNSMGSSTQAGNQNPHWRTVFIALVLALAIGSTGQTPSVIAAPAGMPVNVYMELVNPKTTVCVGKTAQYPVRVYTPPTTSGSFDFDRYALPGIKVEGFSQDKTVGDFLGAKKGTLTTRTTAPSDEDIDEAGGFEPTPNTAYFTFKAKKAGTTTLYFEASAHGQYVSDKVSVRVINCEYEIRTNSTWVFDTQYGTAFFFESMKAKMTVDEQGNLTSSSESGVAWVYTQFIPNYTSSTSISRGTAVLSGRIDENGQLLLNIKFSSVDGADTNCGAPGCGAGTFTALADPLIIRLPAAGGTSPVSHSLTAAGKSIPGNTTVTVIPLDGAR